MEKHKILSQKKENLIFLSFEIKKHVPTSREEFKGKLLTKINKRIKRSQSCKK